MYLSSNTIIKISREGNVCHWVPPYHAGRGGTGKRGRGAGKRGSVGGYSGYLTRFCLGCCRGGLSGERSGSGLGHSKGNQKGNSFGNKLATKERAYGQTGRLGGCPGRSLGSASGGVLWVPHSVLSGGCCRGLSGKLYRERPGELKRESKKGIKKETLALKPTHSQSANLRSSGLDGGKSRGH